jgi:predicted transport protein
MDKEVNRMEYVRFEKLSIKGHPSLDEKWVQERIGEDPKILGLGDLILKDKERMQPHAGRLDLLLQDADSTHRYEIEVQLGATDESHIIRTIEYWDLERKRYPQYDHTAVIVAEDITSRFLNILSLFNGMIPLVAVQMQALKYQDKISLVCTTVVDRIQLGLVDEDEEVQEPTDRSYWENRGSKSTLAMVDELLEIIKATDPGLELKYNKFYIGLAKEGKPSNFVIFRPKKNFLRLEPRLPRSDEMQERLEKEGLDVMDYEDRWGRYRIRLSKGDIKKHAEFLAKLLAEAHGVE